jgi:dihydropteroate synthase
MTLTPWHIRDRTFAWGTRTYLMGVLNLTPDSFSDGGLHDSVETAIAHANEMIPYIDILDIGGESTRPGAAAVSVEVELERVIPVIEAIRALYPHLPISIDTTKAAVADAALRAGADIVNDVAAGRFDLDMLPTVSKHKAPYILMHMQGSPRTMQSNPRYKNVAQEVKRFLKDGVTIANAAGITQVAIDPGIGFGKTLDHNLALLRELAGLQSIAVPILVGVSRKSFIGKLCAQPDPTQRVFGTAAACVVAIANGADILRVHDPKEISDICRVADAIYRPDYVVPEVVAGDKLADRDRVSSVNSSNSGNPGKNTDRQLNGSLIVDAQESSDPDAEVNAEDELGADAESLASEATAIARLELDSGNNSAVRQKATAKASPKHKSGKKGKRHKHKTVKSADS